MMPFKNITKDQMATTLRWMTKFVTWLCVIILALILYFACVGCVASKTYVEERVAALEQAIDNRAEDLKEYATGAAVRQSRPVDAVIPGYSEFTEACWKEAVIPAPKPIPDPPEEDIPWQELMIAVASALGLGVPASVVTVNRIRDQRRRQRGEALTPEEAAKKGYYTEST